MSWEKARKKPIEVEYKGPFYVKPSDIHESNKTSVIETIEGEFEITDSYLQEHEGYVIIKGVQGEVYPCALDVFKETYQTIE